MAGSVGMMGMSSTTTKSFSSAEKKFSVEGATDSAFSVISGTSVSVASSIVSVAEPECPARFPTERR